MPQDPAATQAFEPTPVPIVKLTAGAAVSVLTVLQGYIQLLGYSKLVFTFINTGAVSATVYLDTSQDGSSPDGSKKTQLTVAPGGNQESIELDDNLRRYYAMSADTIAAGGGSTTIKVEIMGVPRY